MDKDELYNLMMAKIEARGPYKIYQSFEQLNIDGQRPTEMRYHIYGLNELINFNKTVLDLGSNIGFMSLFCAQHAREVYGIERYSYWIEIAELAAKILDIDNVHFHCCDALAFQMPYEFDVMLSLSFHHWGPDIFVKYAQKVFIGMLKKGGYLIFESHRLSPKDPFELYADYLLCNGFAEIRSDHIQCPTDYPRPNPLRKYYVLQLMEK